MGQSIVQPHLTDGNVVVACTKKKTSSLQDFFTKTKKISIILFLQVTYQIERHVPRGR